MLKQRLWYGLFIANKYFFINTENLEPWCLYMCVCVYPESTKKMTYLRKMVSDSDTSL